MRRVTIRLTPEQVEAVVRLAERNYRDPSDQLAYMVAKSLERMTAKAPENKNAALTAATVSRP
jgi:hypothetical protein